MKAKNFCRLALSGFIAIATPAAMAEKPGTELSKDEAPTEAPTRGAARGSETTTPIPGRAASQPGRPDGKTEASDAMGAVSSVIASNPSFSTLRKAIAQAGLESTLADEKASYTIFAPTDSAFGKLPTGTLGKLMEPANKEKLRSLLLYHVVSGKISAAEVKSGDVKSLNGETLKVAAAAGKVQVDNATVSTPDMMASNGVIHSIDTVLIPNSLEKEIGR